MNKEQTRQQLLALGLEPLPKGNHYLFSLSGANMSGMNLTGFDLSSCDLSRTNLRDAVLDGVNALYTDFTAADFRGASMEHANLLTANLSHTDLREASLAWSDLGLARLDGADARDSAFDYTNLTGANISDMSIDYWSRELVAHVLLNAAGNDIAKQSLAGLVLISRNWCWEKFEGVGIDPALRDWALDTLVKSIRREPVDLPPALRAYRERMEVA